MKLPLTACCILLVSAPVALQGVRTASTGAAPAPAVSVLDSTRTLNTARNALRAYARRATPANVRELRPDVIERLDELARAIPGDDWIIGHRVGLRIKQGWSTAAVATALRCEATAWWCHALTGFALHAEGSFHDAEQALDRALEGMPPELRCEWGRELLHVLDGTLRSQYAAADCLERQSIEARMWWLADPLFMVPGNDRRTEHYARLIGMHLHHDILAQLRRQPCADQHHHAVMRGGWPDAWWGPGPLEARAEGFRFLPGDNAWREPLASTPEDWQIAAAPSTERYFPAYGDMRELEQQTAFFARGDSLLVLAAANFGRVTAAGLVLARDPHESPTVVQLRQGGSWPLRATVPRGAWLVAIEAIREPAGVSRARFGHSLPEPQPGAPGLSDVLLFNWADQLAHDLEAVAPRTMITTRFARSREVGMYWEVYGSAEDDVFTVSLAAEPEAGGALRRLAEGLRLAAARDGVAVQWQDAPDGQGVLRTHLRLDLGQLEPGRYTLRLDVRRGDGPATTVRRQIELTGPQAR